MHTSLSSRVPLRALALLVSTIALIGTSLTGVTAPGGTPLAEAQQPRVTRLSLAAPVLVDIRPAVRPIAKPIPIAGRPTQRATTAPTTKAKPALRRTAPPATRPPAPKPAPFTQAEAERRGRAAFASLQRPLPAGWQLKIAVHTGSRVGWADAKTRVVALWVRPSDTQSQLRITLAHELGHVVDFTVMTNDDRQSYRQLRGRDGDRSPWYPEAGTTDFASPAGDFAEVYALWRGGAGDFRSTWAAQPSSAQLKQIEVLLHDLESR